jgi:hypothetical protein
MAIAHFFRQPPPIDALGALGEHLDDQAGVLEVVVLTYLLPR